MYRLSGYTEQRWVDDISRLFQKNVFTYHEGRLVAEQLTFSDLTDKGYDYWVDILNVWQGEIFPFDCE